MQTSILWNKILGRSLSIKVCYCEQENYAACQLEDKLDTSGMKSLILCLPHNC